MKGILLLLILLLAPVLGFGQIERTNRTLPERVEGTPETRAESDEEAPRNEQKKALEEEKAPVTDYKIISVANDTTVVDTSLTIEDDYRFNYLRKDNFGLLPFSNVGRPYNRLVYNFRDLNKNLIPAFGARARHFNFQEVEDIFYYHVPTPYTKIYYRSVYEQGQTLKTLFTVNTSPNLNLFIGYKGLRSLGKYQNILTSTGNFRMGGTFHTRNDRYHLKTHFVSQDFMSQENGGLSALALEQYLSEDEEFQDRSRLTMNFNDAESTLYGKRFYLEHSYDLLTSGDSLASRKLSIGHLLDFSDKKFVFKQGAARELYGPSFETVNLRDEVKLENIYNELSLGYDDRLLGNFIFKAAMTNFNYGYNAVLELEEGRVDNRLLGEMISVGGEYEKTLGGFYLQANITAGITGEFKGNNIDASLGYDFRDLGRMSVWINRNEKAPNFNFLLYQSDYINYNWQTNFGNVATNSIGFRFDSSRLLNVEGSYSNISNYTYFGLNEESLVKPFQHGGSVQYFKIKAEKELRWWKLGLNNTLLFQEVLEGEEVFHVPSLVARSTFYFEDQWFRKALFLQTGLTLNYFTDYYMNGYDPVLAEFFVQGQERIEGFPAVDFFFNGKIRQARVFLKLEHVNSLLMGNNNFSAPLYPYRDFGVRFGLEWDFFM